MKVLGFRRVDFAGKDGKQITGYSVFCSELIKPEFGAGVSVEKVFLSDRRLGQMGYMPCIGDDLQVNYNRYGKLSSVVLLDGLGE